MHRQNWLSRTVRRVLRLGGERQGEVNRRRLDRRRLATLAGERLEDRRVMAGGLGLQFNIAYTASVPAQVKTAFQTAADHWSSILTDDIMVNVTVDFTATAAGVGQASPVSLTKYLTDFRAALDADRRTLADDTAVAHLPAGDGAALYTTDFDTGLPLLDDNGTDNNKVLLLTRANAKALGFVPATSPSSDGTIKFLSKVVYDYDPSNGIGAGRYDFIGVAMHEIGHLLGFVSGADVVDLRSKPNGPGYNAGIDQDNYIVARPLDLFRQSSDALAAGADFDLRADQASKYFSLDHGATALGTFSTGRHNGNGDENQHWLDDQQLGLMDPSLVYAEPGKLSALDVLALDVLGWDPRMDYGDAPDTTAGTGADDYRTLRSGDGPRHGLFAPTGLGGDFEGTPRVYLGAGVDRELDGQPEATAQGDDTHGADDESGLAAMPPLVAGTNLAVSIASSASAASPAQLDYFVDFNRDGDFVDPGEALHATLVSSMQSVPLVVPADASLGETIVRLRISTTGGLGPHGPAADGEVEDYRASIVAPPAPAPIDVWGTSGDDSFTVAYSTTDVTVSQGVNGSAESLVGVYPAGVTVRVHGQDGQDRLALVVLPTQLGDWTTAQLVTLKDYVAASTGKTLSLDVPGVGALQAQDLETARLLVDDDQQRYDLSACLPSITTAAQIQIGGAGDDVLVGTNQVDLIFGQGGSDLLYALDGADWLFGGAGADLIYGGNADDQLWGGSGDDYLNGGAGADRLSGGDGVDSVTTGAGRDVISFVGDQASIDVVTDFALYYDVLDLRDYQTSYAQLTYDFATYPGETLISVAGGKKIRLANWTTFVGVGQVVA